MATKNPIRRKSTAKIDDRYRLQAYIEQEDKALVLRAIKIQGEVDSLHKSISGFASRAVLSEAKRIIAEHERTTKKAASR